MVSMFFTIPLAFGAMVGEDGVGVATSERPEGPFTDRGVVLMGRDFNVCNSIDQFYIEEGGKKIYGVGKLLGHIHHTTH